MKLMRESDDWPQLQWVMAHDPARDSTGTLAGAEVCASRGNSYHPSSLGCYVACHSSRGCIVGLGCDLLVVEDAGCIAGSARASERKVLCAARYYACICLLEICSACVCTCYHNRDCHTSQVGQKLMFHSELHLKWLQKRQCHYLQSQ